MIGAAARLAAIEWWGEFDQSDAEEGSALLAGARVWSLAPQAGAYAAEVAALALAEYRAGRTLQAAELRALYVRLSDAEMNERCHV